MKISTICILLFFLCLSCNNNDKKAQKQEDRKSSLHQEVMPEKGKR